MPGGNRLMANCATVGNTGGVAFGKITLSTDEIAFYDEVNRQIPALCQSLPTALKTDALLFFMRYAGIGPADRIDFFWRFPAPAWSIVYWLRQAGYVDGISRGDPTVDLAVQAHTMAMCLHSLDDHLLDGELPVLPLTLLLRSQSWLIMMKALEGLTADLPEGPRMVDRYLGDYIGSLNGGPSAATLEEYCGAFRRQMASGFIVPVLLVMRSKGDRRTAGRIEAAFASFGIAWRLQDDLQDIHFDMARSAPSAVYCCLSDEAKALWNATAPEDSSHFEDQTARILDCLRNERVHERLCRRIWTELDKSANLMNACRLVGLAHEIRRLARPFRIRRECF